MRDIQHWWLARMIETPRPLQEKMTLFWHGHFATSYRGIQDSYHMFQQNRLFRSHAVGNVKALSHGIIRDAAVSQQRPHPQRVDRLVEFVEARGGRMDNAMLVALLALITAMPEYQLT